MKRLHFNTVLDDMIHDILEFIYFTSYFNPGPDYRNARKVTKSLSSCSLSALVFQQ